MSILAKNGISFWRENSNVGKIRFKKLTFKTFSPLKASTNQRCAYCKHFGASVKCMASGKMYHFPCAAASGSFMHKPTMTLVGTESLSKVSTYSDNAMYLYHNGEAWKFGKVWCFKFSQSFSKVRFFPKLKF